MTPQVLPDLVCPFHTTYKNSEVSGNSGEKTLGKGRKMRYGEQGIYNVIKKKRLSEEQLTGQIKN